MNCICGSDKPQHRNYDARGIYLCATCEDCYERKMAIYRPEVLTDSDYGHDEPIDDYC